MNHNNAFLPYSSDSLYLELKNHKLKKKNQTNFGQGENYNRKVYAMS